MSGFFEWDESKSEACLASRGFNFSYAALIFDGPTMEIEDDRRGYGERRIQAIGRVGIDVLFVVYTWRGRPADHLGAPGKSKGARCLLDG